MVEHSLRHNARFSLGQLFLHPFDSTPFESCRKVFLGSRSFMLPMYEPNIWMDDKPSRQNKMAVMAGCRKLLAKAKLLSTLISPHLYPVWFMCSTCTILF